MNEVVLSGCTPEPLMSYLKTLGVFRLVAEQLDPTAKLSWHGGVACLHSTLDRDGLIKFFQSDYRPTPVVGPWGARSGFYPGSSESSAREALNRIVADAESRPSLTVFRDVIIELRNIMKSSGFTVKVRDEDKLTLMRLCRNKLPDAMLGWLDAVFILTDESRRFPPLLGTGGNEGSGSYVSTFAQVVVSLLIDHDCDGGVANALFGDFTSSLGQLAVGHFNPGAIGGANSSQGFDGGGGVNPWDYLLAIEGSVLFAGAVSRRMGMDTVARAGYPFCVEAVAVGYASESEKEAGESTRAELWLPLWKTPFSHAELTHLFAEGRAQLGRRQARNAVEFALAVNLLGISRGVDAFVRYAFVMRNGLSYFAAPLGRLAATPRPAARLLDDQPLTAWVERLRSACRDKEKTPARYQTALRQIDRAMFAFANRSESDVRADRRALVNVMRAVGCAERTLATGLAFCKDKYIRPLQGLSPQWLDQANDDSTEFRLAVSLAGVLGSGKVGPLRVFLEEVEMKGTFANWSPGSTSAVWSRRSLAANLAAVFRRRQMEAFREGQFGVQMDSPRPARLSAEGGGEVDEGARVPMDSRRPARLSDVIAFLHAEIDDEKLHDLIWGLISLDWPNIKYEPPNQIDTGIPFEFGAPRILLRQQSFVANGKSWKLASETEPNAKPDPKVFHILSSGQSTAVEHCVDIAARRLKSGGLIVTGYHNRQQAGKPLGVKSSIPADRLLASMLLPLSNQDIEMIANSVLYPPETEESS